MDSAVRSSIERSISENPVVLYMKGTRGQPQCGFSARVVEVLDTLLAEYVTIDVLADASLREGVKEYSSWPTIPQLYVRGEFVGGSDIVSALHESGELGEKLGELAQPAKPNMSVSEAARAELAAALESSDECIRLDVSPAFEHDLCVGVPDPRDLVVEVAGLRISMPPASASTRSSTNWAASNTATRARPAPRSAWPKAWRRCVFPTPGRPTMTSGL